MRRGMKHLVCVMFLLLACQAGAFEIREISCNQMPEPIGVDCRQMRFSWKVESKERDYRQQAYQIEIRESTSGRVVWNSGRRESEESVLVPYGGETLKPATTYIYRVRAWNTAGKSSKWSASRHSDVGDSAGEQHGPGDAAYRAKRGGETGWNGSSRREICQNGRKEGRAGLG